MSSSPPRPPSIRPPPPPKTPESRVRQSDRVGQLEGQALEVTVGAVAGAVVGSLAGPVGAAAGAAVGGAVGAALAHQMRRADHEEAVHDRQLDAGEEVEEVPPEVNEELPGVSSEELQKELG